MGSARLRGDNQMPSLVELSAKWLECKKYEQIAINTRRDLEDQILALIHLPDNLEGVITETPDDYVIKITGRITRTVDGELAQEIASEYGLSEHLSTLFRWTPSINAKAWKTTSKEITDILAEAITAKPARATFKITKE